MIWFPVIGLILTAFGVVLGLSAPRVTAVWGGPETEKQDRILRWRYAFSILLILVGTVLQAIAAWPAK